MTAKEYLSQSFRLNAKINADICEIEYLWALAKSIPSTNAAQDKVQTNSPKDCIGDTVTKIIDLETKINNEIKKFVDLRKEIRDRLNMMTDDNLRLILQKRYLNFQKWEQIAVDLNFTFQWVHILHKRALDKFEKLIQVDCN